MNSFKCLYVQTMDNLTEMRLQYIIFPRMLEDGEILVNRTCIIF